MNSFWEMRWYEVYAYGMLLPILILGTILAWKLAQAVIRPLQRLAAHRAATQLLRNNRPAPDDRWSWLDWQWAFSQITVKQGKKDD